MKSINKSREHLIATALTVCITLSLFLVAGMARFARAPGENLVLVFEKVLNPVPPTSSAPEPAVTTPAVTTIAVQRSAISPALLPTNSAVDRPRERLETRTPTRSSTLEAANSSERPIVRSSRPGRRALIPHTRVSRLPSTGISLSTPATLDTSSIKRPQPSVTQLKPESRDLVERKEHTPELLEALQDKNIRRSLIIEWMRRHPSELPPGIKQHLGHTDDTITSVDTLALEDLRAGTQVLYLMAYPAVQELHVILISEGRSFYFIDRGAQGEGHKFRVGEVLSSGGDIAGIVSEDSPLDSPDGSFLFQRIFAWLESKTAEH